MGVPLSFFLSYSAEENQIHIVLVFYLFLNGMGVSASDNVDYGNRIRSRLFIFVTRLAKIMEFSSTLDVEFGNLSVLIIVYLHLFGGVLNLATSVSIQLDFAAKIRVFCGY